MAVTGFVLTTVASTRSPSAMSTHCQELTMPLMPWDLPSISLSLTYVLVVGKFQWLLKIGKRRLSSPNVMPFGSSNAPATLQRFIDALFANSAAVSPTFTTTLSIHRSDCYTFSTCVRCLTVFAWLGPRSSQGSAGLPTNKLLTLPT